MVSIQRLFLDIEIWEGAGFFPLLFVDSLTKMFKSTIFFPFCNVVMLLCEA